MYLEGMVDIQILNNYVRSTYHGIYLRFVNYYVKSSSQSSVVNNMVITTGSFYAVLRMEYIRKLNVHHNSFLSATFYCLLMADTDSLDIQNNIFENHAKLGNVVAMGSAKFSSNYKMDNNLYYVPNSTSPHVFVGSVSYDSVAQWFSSSTGINQHSSNKNPYFKSDTDLHILNKGRYSGDSLGVLTDFDGTTRCLYAPTIGAHELVNKTLPDTSIVHPVCLGDTLAFTLNPPTGLLANDYGKTWALDSLAIETNNGFKTSNYSIRATKGKAVELLFYPDSTDVDSTFLLHFNVLNQSYKGCDSSAGHYIEVHGTPQAGFLIDTNFVCLGHRTKLTNTSITGSSTVQYKWQMGNGFSSTQKALDYTYRKTGFYQIRLTASTPFCQDEITKSIYVGSSKGATIVPDTLFAGRMGDGSALNPDQACVGDTLVYKISAPTGFDNTEYDSLWNISSISWNNTSSTKFDSLTALPDSINDFTLQWLADSSMSGDTLQLTIEVASTLVPNCTNTLIRHIVITLYRWVNVHRRSIGR
jgi:PKD repeat protein